MNPIETESKSRRDRLSAVLRDAGDFVTVDGAAKVLGLDRTTTAKTLSRWSDQGWLKRVRRGLYMPVPLTAGRSEQVIEDSWTLVPELFSPGYVGGATAAHHWDLTEQIFRTVFVFTTRPVRQSEQTVEGIPFSVHHVREGLLFGTRSLWRGRVRIQVSDMNRTIIDMMNDPAVGGGMRHVAECLAAYCQRSDADPERLIEYGDRLGNGAVFKRLGFLLERIDGPVAVIDACRARLTKGNAKLDPAVPARRLVRRWRLWVPARWHMTAARQ
ncbi:MAG: type IV toxin-antitoxin system AbiEi family antitoxin domain-containing protein [Longimicrobiales bacterium]